jgi:prepilin-type N-terminal cleavage/methylation domain-containing protein
MLGDGGLQRGLALIELVIAIAIVGLVAGAIVASVYQLLTATGQANNQEYAVSQLRQAEHYISRDTLMTWRISSSGFPLSLYWETEEDNRSYEVEYSLVGSVGNTRQLRRHMLVKDIDSGATVEDSTLIVAGDIHIDSHCTFAAPSLTVTLKVPASDASDPDFEVRVFEVTPRKSSVEVT